VDTPGIASRPKTPSTTFGRGPRIGGPLPTGKVVGVDRWDVVGVSSVECETDLSSRASVLVLQPHKLVALHLRREGGGR